MKHAPVKSGLVRRYSAVFYGVMLLLAAGLTVLMLYFASERFVTYELTNIRDTLTQAANDLETQHGVMRDVVTQIRASSEYRPSILTVNSYRDIELLNDFRRFSNYSPLIENYFLLYHGSRRLYTSEGKISYYEFYSAANLGLMPKEAEEFYDFINDLKTETTIRLGEKAIFAFPVRFVNEESDKGNAVICFLLPESALLKRVLSFHPQGAEIAALRLGNVTVAGADEEFPLGTRNVEGDNFRITTQSEGGFAELSCLVRVNRYELLLSALPAWLYIGIVLLILLVALLGVLFGKMILGPIRNLVVKYMSPDEYIRDELEGLDRMISRMEEENHNSRRLLRDRMLGAILQGYYSRQLMERWGFLHLSFEHERYCVSVCRKPGSEAESEKLLDQLENQSSTELSIYACRTLTGDLIALIIGYDSDAAKSTGFERILAVLGETTELYSGREYPTAQRISTSYMEAVNEMTAARGEEKADLHRFVMRMIAYSQEGREEEMEREARELSCAYENASAHAVRHFAFAVSAELTAAAAEKRVSVDKDSLLSLTTLTDFGLCLHDAIEIIRTAFPYSDKKGSGKPARLTESIIAFIGENAFDPDFDLQAVAQKFDLSSDYISSLLKAALGESFKEYLTRLRMAEAGRLLREQPTLTVAEVSARAGYRKVSNFIKKFKDIHGVTPSQYR